MIVNDCIHKVIKSWPLPDITPFSCMQKIEVTGASNLASLFYIKGVFIRSIMLQGWWLTAYVCIPELHRSYDLLQYPMLFPHGMMAGHGM